MGSTDRILWVDGLGGLGAGILVTLIHGPLSRFYGWPLGFALAMGAVNLVYGSYSFTLARRGARPRAAVSFLAGANVLWGLGCFVLAYFLWERATAFGRAHLALEGLYVGGLGVLEWRWRGALSGDDEGTRRSPGRDPD